MRTSEQLPEHQPTPATEPIDAARRLYALARGEGRHVWFLGSLMTIKADSGQTEGAMSLIEQVAPPGFASPLHLHHGEDEPMYVLEGATPSGWATGSCTPRPAPSSTCPGACRTASGSKDPNPGGCCSSPCPAGWSAASRRWDHRPPARSCRHLRPDHRPGRAHPAGADHHPRPGRGARSTTGAARVPPPRAAPLPAHVTPRLPRPFSRRSPASRPAPCTAGRPGTAVGPAPAGTCGPRVGSRSVPG
jgi:hypothetical protein